MDWTDQHHNSDGNVATIEYEQQATTPATINPELAAWQEQEANAPTAEMVEHLAREVAEAEQIAEAARAAHGRAAAHRATVYGWTTIASEMGVSPRRLHTWHREYASDLADRSGVPEKIERAERRKAETLARRIEKAAQQQAEYEEAEQRLRARLAQIRNGEQR